MAIVLPPISHEVLGWNTCTERQYVESFQHIEILSLRNQLFLLDYVKTEFYIEHDVSPIGFCELTSLAIW